MSSAMSSVASVLATRRASLSSGDLRDAAEWFKFCVMRHVNDFSVYQGKNNINYSIRQ
jgi:hypothetical protein